MKNRNNKRYSDWETYAMLIAYENGISIDEISKTLRRSPGAIAQRIKTLDDSGLDSTYVATQIAEDRSGAVQLPEINDLGRIEWNDAPADLHKLQPPQPEIIATYPPGIYQPATQSKIELQSGNDRLKAETQPYGGLSTIIFHLKTPNNMIFLFDRYPSRLAKTEITMYRENRRDLDRFESPIEVALLLQITGRRWEIVVGETNEESWSFKRVGDQDAITIPACPTIAEFVSATKRIAGVNV